MELTTSEKFNLHKGTDEAVAVKEVKEEVKEEVQPIDLKDVQVQLAKTVDLVESYYKYSNKKEAYDCLITAERAAACLE